MSDRAQEALFLAAGTAVAVVVGRASAGDSQALRLTALIVFAFLGVIVLRRPVVAVYVGIAVLTLQVTASTILPALTASVLLLEGVLVGWRTASSTQRRVAATMLALLGWVLGMGVILAPPDPQQTGIAVAFLFAMALGACAVICQPPAGLIVLTACGWGAAAAFWVFRHPDQLSDRSGDLALGTNADGLGILIAVGAVAFTGYVIERRPRLRLVAVPVALVAFLAMTGTGSRGALLSFATGLILASIPVTLLNRPRRALAVISLIVVVFWLSAEWVAQHFLQLGDRQILVAHGLDLRREVAQFALEQGLTHPVTGIGVGLLEEAAYQEFGLTVSAHNIYAGIFAAAGLPALVLLVAWLVLAAGQAIRVTARLGLPLLMAVVSAGLAVEWWTSATLAPLFALCVSVSLTQGWQPATVHASDLPHDDLAI